MAPHQPLTPAGTEAPSVDPARIAVIIPARLASTRLPNKPLAMIGGAPMILQVWRRAVEAGFGGGGGPRLIVACDDPAISYPIKTVDGETVLTSPDHPSGSDRVHEAVETVDPEGRVEFVVNLQGDLPEIDCGMLWGLVRALAEGGVDIATPVARATPWEVGLDQVVKAAVAFPEDAGPNPPPGATGRVLDFSRRPIPDGGGGGAVPPAWHHIGVYAWRRSALARFVGLPPSPRETAEGLEQLRALEDGMAITAVVVDSAPGGIDTPFDLAAVRKRFDEFEPEGE